MRAASKAPSAKSGLVAALTGAVFLFPLGYLLWETLRLGGDFGATATSPSTTGPLSRSLLIATASAIVSGLLGTGLAVLISRTDLPGRRVLRVALALPLAIPSFVGATALLAAFGPGGLIPAIPRPQGFWGSLLVLTLLSYPYVYLPVMARLRTTAPVLEEAARQLGSGPRRTVFRVVLPQARGAVAAGTMLVFLYALSDFGAVSLMRYDTITRAIFTSRLFDRTTSLTLGLVLALLALGVAAVERVVNTGRDAESVAAKVLPKYELGRVRHLVGALVLVVLAVGLLAPIVVFITWILRGSGTIGIGYSGLGDDLGFLLQPTINSILAAVVAGAAAVLLLLPLAFISIRRRTRWAGGASASVSSVFALPGLVVALAIVFWAIQASGPLAGLYQSFPLLVLAYVLNFGALSLRSSQAAIASVPARFDEAARTLGVGAVRRFREIELPLIAPGLISGGGLVLLSTLKELPATLLLAPIGFRTLATRIWGAAEDGFYAEVGVTALTLIAVSGVLTWVLVVRPTLRAGHRTQSLGTSGPR